MSGNGWIKLHRKFLEKGYYQRSQYVHLWVHLLLRANHKPKEYMTNGKIILIKEGQLLTGRKQLALETGIPESTVEDILKMFENEQQIQQQKTTKYRLITVVNWNSYQESNNKATTKQQQADTNKNDKNEENASALEYEPRVVKILEEDEERPRKKSKYPNAKTVFSWFPFQEKSWTLNTTELKHAELLFSRGEERVRGILNFCQANNIDVFLPDWESPAILERNWNKIIKFAERNGI